jgi:ribonucleotide monophosphatase NagD (HAD superfamily)
MQGIRLEKGFIDLIDKYEAFIFDMDGVIVNIK